VVLVLWFVSIAYVYGLGALAGKYAPHLAERSMVRAANLLSVFGPDYKPCGDTPALECGFQNTEGRQEVSCADYQGEGAAVLLTFGQSNSANAGEARYIPAGPVANFNIHDGKCYLAEDPLLGPDGPGGSVWGVLADKLIVNGDYNRVLIAPFGIGGSSISQWQADGFLHPVLTRATKAINDNNITPTHVLWHQGETDASEATPQAEYVEKFKFLQSVLLDAGVNAPIHVAMATHCQIPHIDPDPNIAAGQASVRAAQQELATLPGMAAGPDTDTIQGELYRHDNCHFNAKGMQAHAKLWREVIVGG
ncbi:MAG: sialate O-acetylesterase, partial [Halioglobus sp.]